MRIWQPQFERRKCHGPSHMQNVADKWHYRKQPLWKRLASNLFVPKYLRMESLGFPCCCDDDVCNCHCVCNVFTDPEDTGESCAPCCVWVLIQYTGTASDGLHALMQSEFNDCLWGNCDESVRMSVISAGGESWININASDNMFQKIYPGNNSLKCSDVGDGIFDFEHIHPDPSPSPTPLCYLTIAEGNDNAACSCEGTGECNCCDGDLVDTTLSLTLSDFIDDRGYLDLNCYNYFPCYEGTYSLPYKFFYSTEGIAGIIYCIYGWGYCGPRSECNPGELGVDGGICGTGIAQVGVYYICVLGSDNPGEWGVSIGPLCDTSTIDYITAQSFPVTSNPCNMTGSGSLYRVPEAGIPIGPGPDYVGHYELSQE